MIYDKKIQGDLVMLQSISKCNCNEVYLAWLNDISVNRYLETRWEEQSIEKIISFVEDINNSSHSWLFGIFERKTGKHIGNIKIGPVHLRYSYADISYFIGDKDCWGKGYATEAILLITKFGFKELGLHRLQAGAFSLNIGSIKALIKAGYKEEGRLREQLYTENLIDDRICLAMLKHEFEQDG